MSEDLAPALGAELIGTFALVFAGTGAIVVDAQAPGSLGHLGVALSFGLVIMIMVYATGHISGAHLNPAVTLAFALVRHFPATRVLSYLAVQLTGATLGSLAVRALIGDAGGLGVTHPRGAAGPAMVLEALLTFVLMFVIMAVATDVRAVGSAAALAIGGTIALEALFAGPLTGASMNPARSVGPALVSGNWADLWIYCGGPPVGAALGALAYRLLRGPAPARHAEPARA